MRVVVRGSAGGSVWGWVEEMVAKGEGVGWWPLGAGGGGSVIWMSSLGSGKRDLPFEMSLVLRVRASGSSSSSSSCCTERLLLLPARLFLSAISSISSSVILSTCFSFFGSGLRFATGLRAATLRL